MEYLRDSVAALNRGSGTGVSVAGDVGGGGDRKKGHGKSGESGELREHVDSA